MNLRPQQTGVKIPKCFGLGTQDSGETNLSLSSLKTTSGYSEAILEDRIMKRIVILVVLVLLAGVAGIVVRSANRPNGTVAELRGLVSHNATGDVRDEIRQTYQLSPGATVELSNLNGSIKIETSQTNTAEVLIERTADSQDSLSRRKVMVDADNSGLRIRGQRGDAGFLSRIFGSRPSEKVTLKLPRQISLIVKGVNGAIMVGELDGPVDVRGINGRVQIAQATGRADFKGINGNIVVGLRDLMTDGVSLNGINGNIELQLAQSVNADLDAKGMNGRVVSDMPGVVVEKDKRGSFSAHIGTGGSAIAVHGINGNVRLTSAQVLTTAVETLDKSSAAKGN